MTMNKQWDDELERYISLHVGDGKKLPQVLGASVDYGRINSRSHLIVTNVGDGMFKATVGDVEKFFSEEEQDE
jgi:hypothetical protein